MQLSGEVTIAAARPVVWAALNDPEVLARCIEGVETLTRITDEKGERFEGKMNAKVGPVRATFTGQVTLTDVVTPERYVLVGEGKGGVAGFAKGKAAVALTVISPMETQLAYDVQSSVGGKLAQLGARLIEGTAKSYAESFFSRLKAEVEMPAETVLTTPEPAQLVNKPDPLPEAGNTSVSPLVWGGALVLAVLAFLLYQWV